MCDGAGSCVACLVAADCPGQDTECQQRTCGAGACGLTYAAENQVATARQKVRDLQEQIAGATLDAPTDGLVTEVNVAPGFDAPAGAAIVIDAPTYEVTTDTGETVVVTNPSEYPDGRVAEVSEPVVKVGILLPKDYVGTVMELCQSRRGSLLGMDYLSEDRVELRYHMPLG